MVADASKLEEDFARCLQAAQSNAISNVRVKIWLPQMVKLIECKQIAPAIVDLKKQIAVEQRYSQYRAIPYEADAHEVGDAAEQEFRGWPGATTPQQTGATAPQKAAPAIK